MTRFYRLILSLLILGSQVFLSASIILAQQSTPDSIFLPLSRTVTATPTRDMSQVVTAVPTQSQVVTATPRPRSEPIEKREHHVLKRPVALVEGNVHWVDRTYPYGGTQLGRREVHLGVEFVNKRYTPVLSSLDGEVVFAGTDDEIPIGPYINYYGYVIVIAHELDTLDGLQIFTLYGHLDRVEVEAGQKVATGDRIGRVGSSGIAVGAHLHFEVRAGEPFDYQATRNPELWLQYYVDHGMIAGYVHNAEGDPIYDQRIVVRAENFTREIFTYASDRVNSDGTWQENFTIGDLPDGDYEVVILNDRGLVVYRNSVTVEAYKTTFLDILMQ